MSILTRLLGPMGGKPNTSSNAAAATVSADPAAAAATDDKREELMSMMGAVQSPEPHRVQVPQTTFPEVPRAMNPQFSQMLMQMMLGANGGQSARPTLGSILRGQ